MVGEIMVRPHRREGDLGDFDWDKKRVSFTCDYCGGIDPEAVAVWLHWPDMDSWFDSFRLCQDCAVKLRDALTLATAEDTLDTVREIH